MMSSNEENKQADQERGPGRGRMHRHGHGPEHFRRHRWKIPFVVIGFVLVKSAAVLLLWNALIPELFHGPELTYLQALGMTVLAKLLVGFQGFRGFGGFGGHHRGHFGPHRHWQNFSPEERNNLREEFRKRFDEKFKAE